MLHLIAVLTLVAQTPASAAAVKVSPAVVAEFSLGAMKGKLIRQLAWSPDGTQLYLMTYDPNKDASVKEMFHFLIPAHGGAPSRPTQIDAQPDWAVKYYEWKAGRTSPDDPSVELTPNHERRKESAVSTPMGGDLARGGTSGDPASGLSSTEAMDAARAMQMSDVYTIALKNEIIGEWVNHPTVPGQTFGWAPKGTPLIAFAERKTGRLVIMDLKGGKQKIDDTKNVTVPAWSGDATKLAYLENRGRDKYALIVATVAR